MLSKFVWGVPTPGTRSSTQATFSRLHSPPGCSWLLLGATSPPVPAPPHPILQSLLPCWSPTPPTSSWGAGIPFLSRRSSVKKWGNTRRKSTTFPGKQMCSYQAMTMAWSSFSCSVLIRIHSAYTLSVFYFNSGKSGGFPFFKNLFFLFNVYMQKPPYYFT